MGINELQKQLGQRKIFTTSDVKKYHPNFYSSRLTEWQKRGIVKKIVKGVYILADAQIDDVALFEVANIIYPPSYISLESALSYYNLIPEGVYTTTSVSTRRTYSFNTPLGVFDFRNVKPEIYFGYKSFDIYAGKYLIANPEKALLDFIYLNAYVKNAEDLEELRLNQEVFKEIMDIDTLNTYTERIGNGRVRKVIDKMLKIYKYD